MERKMKVAVIYGGKSPEYYISVKSARNVLKAIDRSKYDVVVIGITNDGHWHLQDYDYVVNPPTANIHVQKSTDEVAFLPEGKGVIYNITDPSKRDVVDVVFPVLHGIYGEDGTVQGILRLANVPFVGCSVLSSSVCMDKDVTKRLLRDAGIPIVDYTVLTYDRFDRKKDYTELLYRFGKRFFIKPANGGSSFGIAKINEDNEIHLTTLIKKAFKYDKKILIEACVDDAREIECGVIGNRIPKASVVGEIIPNDSFYTYSAKYTSDDTKLVIPADLDTEVGHEIRRYARRAYKVLECEGLARVDFFYNKFGEIYLNEVNSMPGFTESSMFPKLWEATGMSTTRLIDRLIELAMERNYKENQFALNY